MEYLGFLCAPGLATIVILWLIFGKKAITPRELCIQVGIAIGSALLSVGILYGMLYSGGVEKEILSGQVTGKERVYTSCSHSYECMCVNICSGSGSSKTCSKVCQTCYQHSNDWDYKVKTTLGNMYIDRIDSRGSKLPYRWLAIEIGEPVADTHIYKNYLKMSDNEFNRTKVFNPNELTHIPEYPEIYDYYRVDRILNMTNYDITDWNKYLAYRLRTLGPEKQLNVIVALTNAPANEFEKIVAKLEGVRKNDVLMVFGLNKNIISWFKSTSLADGQDNRAMHNQLLFATTGNILTTDLFKETIDIIANNYKRVSMSKYKYMADNLIPDLSTLIILLCINFVINIALGYVVVRYDIN